MKKYLIIFLLVLCKPVVHAQFVAIPDSNFRNYIAQNIDSAAIVNNMLDTSNNSVISLKVLEIYFFDNLITDFTGIQYFDSLEVLKLNYLNLTFLPQLPPLLRRLEVQGNQFTSLPPLPPTLQYLDVSYNNLSSLVPLPEGLTVLLAAFNTLQQLPDLSDSLQVLRCQGNQLHYINSFPGKLLEITLWGNLLDSLATLPASLKLLNVSDNRLSFLPAIPDSVDNLYISYNNLSAFPTLPANLYYLDCVKTISCLPPLPNGLQHLNFDGCLSNRPLSLVEYYPICQLPVRFVEVADTAMAVCNDSLLFNSNYASYLWNTGATTSFLSGVCRGIYTATITDTLGCIYSNIIDITDSSLNVNLVVNTEMSCTQVGTCGYVADVTVKGGTPPYRYKWSGANGEIDFTQIADSTEDLIHFCLSDVLSSELVKVVVTDAMGRRDSAIKQVFDNIPPQPYYVDIVNPVCKDYPTGYIYIEDDPFSPGGDIYIMDMNLDTGQYVYTIPYGNSCSQTYTINLTYQFKDCANMYSYNITDPDSGMCNGVFELVDNVDHGIYNLAGTDIDFDGLYLSDGTFVNLTDLCVNTWYYLFVFDFNIGYFIQDSIYVSAPEYTEVYPGDVNNDGIADNHDMLALGIALNEEGYTRLDNTITWTPKIARHWMRYFADSVNMVHADCNGDGIVKASDTTAIMLNYNKQHSRQVNTVFNQLAPVLYITLPDTVVAGSYIDIPVMLGDSQVTADSVSGIAFTLSYDANLIDTSSVRFFPDSNWIGQVGSNLLAISKSFGAGYTDVGYTRNDHTSTSGYGQIGRLRLRFKQITSQSTFVISTADIAYTDEFEFYKTANAFTDSTVIKPAVCDLQAFISVTNHCNNLYGGTATVTLTGGTAPFTYNWSVPGGSQLPVSLDSVATSQDSLPTAEYRVVVTDNTGCKDTVTAAVSSEDGRLITIAKQNPTCPQLCNGWIWVKSDSVSGPAFSSVWYNGHTNAIETGLCKGIYWVTNYWGAGCSRTDTIQLKDPEPLRLAITADSASCTVCDGSAVVSVSGGKKPYSYDWQSLTDTSYQASDSVATGLCYNSIYILTVNDGCNSFTTDSVFFDECDSVTIGISQPDLETIAFNLVPNPNNGNFKINLNHLTGKVLLSVYNTQGEQVYSEWINGEMKEHYINLSGAASGYYVFTVTHSSGIFRLPFIVTKE